MLARFSLLSFVALSGVLATTSPDATCGGNQRYNCLGSQWGDCCSSSGWCGSSDGYCGTGCQLSYGTCNDQPSAIPAQPPTTPAFSSFSMISPTADSPTPTSSSSVCPITGGTNALINGDFQSRLISPWVMDNNGYDDNSLTPSLNVGGPVGSSSWIFGSLHEYKQAVSVNLTQTNVSVPDGTTVNCTAYGSPGSRSPYTTTFTLTIDGQLCGNFTGNYTEGLFYTPWELFGGIVQVTGNTHTVVVTQSSNGLDETIGAAYDFFTKIEVVPISGPC